MRSNGNNSERGTRYSNGGHATTANVDGGHGRLRTRGDGDGRGDATQTESWFEPLSKEEEKMLQDCPGGVCPVPWAVDTRPVFAGHIQRIADLHDLLHSGSEQSLQKIR